MNLDTLASHNLRISSLILLFFLFHTSYSQTATIDLSDEYQKISGFGGANIPDWIGDMNEDQVDKAFGNAPGQIGLNIMRLKVPADESAACTGLALKVGEMPISSRACAPNASWSMSCSATCNASAGSSPRFS